MKRTFGAIRIYNDNNIRQPVATLGVWPGGDGMCLVTLSRCSSKEPSGFKKDEGKRRAAARLASVSKLNRSALEDIYCFPGSEEISFHSEDDRLGLRLLLTSRVVMCRENQVKSLRKALQFLLQNKEARFKVLREFGDE